MSSNNNYLPWIVAANVAWTVIWTVGYTVYSNWKDAKKDRERKEEAVTDEFWTQKILFPSFIEPLTNFVSDTCSNLRNISTDDQATNFDSLLVYTKNKIEELHLQNLVIWRSEDSWNARHDVLLEIELMDDLVTEFCFERRPERRQYVMEELHISMRQIFKTLEQEQLFRKRQK